VRTRTSTRYRLVAAAFALALVASGCGDDEPDSGTVELSFTWWGSDSRHEYTQEIIELFEAEHSNITVEPIFTDFDAYWDQLATSTAGGNAPDIITMEERFLKEYVVNGQLLDLNTVTDALDISSIDELALAAGRFDNGLYTIASGVNAFSVVADPQIFEDAGVAFPDDATWTWQDYVDLAVQISESSGGEVFGAQAFGTNEAGFNVYARQRGEALYNPDGTLGFSAQTLADWWTISLEQTAQGGTPPADVTVEVGATGPDQSLLATNAGAMGTWWTNQLGALSGAAGRELVLLRQPGESEGVRPGMYFKPAMSYSISSQTDHPEEAALFVDFLLNSTGAAELMLNDRGLPANSQVREHIAPMLPDVEQQVADFMAEIGPELVDPPPPPPTGAGETVSIMQRLYEEVLFERVTPLEAAEQFMAEVDAATS
jgi:multiple sugar transport system substrate-binding protein